jgi:transposase
MLFSWYNVKQKLINYLRFINKKFQKTKKNYCKRFRNRLRYIKKYLNFNLLLIRNQNFIVNLKKNEWILASIQLIFTFIL